MKILNALGLIVVLVVTGLIWRDSRKRDLAPLEAQRVEHDTLSVIDSARVKQLEGEVARLERLNARVAARAASSDAAAAIARGRADSLEITARQAPTATDSAAAWQAAHDERKRQADSAMAASAAKDTVIAGKDSTIAAKDSIISTEVFRRQRADRLADSAFAAIDRCEILGLVRCPTRKETAGVGVLTGLLIRLVSSR